LADEKEGSINMFAIQIVGTGDGSPCKYIGQWLQKFDPEAYRGRGAILCTTNIRDAMLFDNGADALMFWNTQSKTVPFRPDGKPNKPLTAYSVVIDAFDI
jgi:hypothetical protein